ncbi:unnamed protein product [Thelazia callipaeda]|uniref:Uncharacterized protein n=1 Tax=Thelazia callipaeda TaxID=103827 RepID=A0A0N5DAI9_THECL|nr:unnamed protein product [Thelazia callipaeda]
MNRLKHRIFRRRSASFTKIDEFAQSKDGDEDECESKIAASSSKTWTNSMGRTLKRRLSIFRKDNDENERYSVMEKYIS